MILDTLKSGDLMRCYLRTYVRYCRENLNTPEAKDEGIFQRFSVNLAVVISGETSLRLDQMCYLETIINQ